MRSLASWIVGGVATVIGLVLLRRAVAAPAHAAPFDVGSPSPPPPSKWTDADFRTLVDASHRLSLNPADLLLIMTSESGLNPSAAYRGKDGRVIAGGLNGMTEAGAGAGGLTVAQIQDFPSWSVAQQLPVVERFMHTALSGVAPPDNAAVLYAYNFAPGHVRSRGTSLDTVLYTKGVDGAAYDLQAVVDHGSKGYITIRDLSYWLSDVANGTGPAVNKSKSAAYKGALARLRAVTGDATLSPTLPT
jgi:hypothetical protein